MSRRDKAHKKHQKELKRQQKNRVASARNSESFQPSLRLEELIDKAHYLIRERHYEEAEQILLGEDRRKRNRPEILDSLICLYQTTQDHVNMARMAERLVRTQPRNPEAWIMMAQGYLLAMRVPMALNAYRHFLERWPEHKNASRAQAAIEIAGIAVQKTLREFDMEDSEFELLVLHDEILFEISCGEFDDAVAKARELLKVKPQLVSARNNLALALFQIGEQDEAVRVCRETCELFPFNRFAEANLGRLLFVTGSVDEAAQIADCIIQDPATQQDAVAMQTEFLSLLGRDADVIKMVEHAATIPDKDARCIAALNHYNAVALMRIGYEKEARRCWETALSHDPSYHPARDNLAELDTTDCHAPWIDPLKKWIPGRVLEQLLQSINRSNGQTLAEALKKFPHIRALIPVLLDRGDRAGREFAVLVASLDGSPDMLDALQTFTFGQRGPDQLRYKVLGTLHEKTHIGRGPHRMSVKGKWHEIILFSPTIHRNTMINNNSAFVDLMNKGYLAMQHDDFESAVPVFRKCVELDPNSPSAMHNLAGAMLACRHSDSWNQAEKMVREIHERFPDYFFGRTSLAQIEIRAGNLDRAKDLLKPLHDLDTMHVSEAMGYFSVSLELSLAHKQIESAEASLRMMMSIEPNDSRIEIYEHRIKQARSKEMPMFRNLLNRFQGTK